MRRFLFLLLLTLPMMARGQTWEAGLSYWFDDDYTSVRHEGTVSGKHHFQADVSQLSAGLHTLHITVTRADGTSSPTVSRFFVKTTARQGVSCYWFDTDRAHTQTLEQEGTQMIDVSGLTEGLHTLNVSATDDGSTVTTRYFVCTVSGHGKGRYWFDTADSLAVNTLMNGAFQIDVSALTEGLHTLHFIAIAPNGSTTQVVNRQFVKLAQLNSIDSVLCRFTIDDEPFLEKRLPADGGIVSYQLDVSSLSQGMHRMMVDATLPSGMPAGSYNVWFLRTSTDSERGNMQCFYSIDGDSIVHQAGQMTGNAWHFDLDVSRLSDGLHRLFYYMSDGRSVHTQSQMTLFVKMPLGGYGMTSWQWWVNDLTDDLHTTTLPKPTDPLSVVQMLPVDHQPLRTQLFHFQAPAGRQPTIFAKNQLHMRFSDVGHRSTEQVFDYIDPTVSQTVEDIGELLSEESHTFAKPAAGNISWFTLPMSPGDSLQLWANGPCWIEAYTAKGDVLYEARDAQSQKVGGFEAPDTLTCYVALHDCQGNGNITLNYRYSRWETPQLAITTDDGNQLGEGQTAVLNIIRNRMQHVSVNLELACSHPSRVKLPGKVVIPAGKDTVQVTVEAIDDECYHAPTEVTFTVSAPRHLDGTLNLTLTDNDTPMDMAEWQLLRQWSQAQGISQWHQPWTFATTPEATDSLPGVVVRQGHVLEVCLNDNGLTGVLNPQIFALPHLRTIDLGNNQIEGKVDEAFAERMTANDSLRTLLLGHNQIGGNIGLLCQGLTALQQLDASYNCFSDVEPALPATLQANRVQLGHQHPDRSLTLSTLGTADSNLPTILFYRHGEEPLGELSMALTDTDGWQATLQLAPPAFNVFSNQRAVYLQPSGSKVTATASNTSHTLDLTMDYDTGDANLDATTDVVDLQSTVRFAMDDYLPGVFCLPAADLLADQQIDVLDVVRLVDLLATASAASRTETDANVGAGPVPARTAASQSGTDANVGAGPVPARTAASQSGTDANVGAGPVPARTAASQSGTDANVGAGPVPARTVAHNTASLLIRNNQLILSTPCPVAAIQVLVAKPNGMPAEWLLRDDGYLLKTRDDGSQVHFIHYSLSGKQIPAGETVLANLPSPDCQVLKASLSDYDAHRIEVWYASDVVTGIMEIVNGEPGMENPVYDLQGRRVDESQVTNRSTQLRKGIYVKRGSKVVK